MKIRLWIYSKTKYTGSLNVNCDLKGEKIVDITIEPYGESFFYVFPIAPQLSIQVGGNRSPSLEFVRRQNSAYRLPDGKTLKIQKNGVICPEPKDVIDATYPITIKDHLEITVTDGRIVETTHVIVVSITPDVPLSEAEPE